MIDDIASSVQIPTHVLTGQFLVGPNAERDIHKYYVTINATMKGLKRRARRRRALLSKLAHKSRRLPHSEM